MQNDGDMVSFFFSFFSYCILLCQQVLSKFALAIGYREAMSVEGSVFQIHVSLAFVKS